MNLSAIRIESIRSAEVPDSLATSLHAVLLANSHDVTLDNIHVAFGHSLSARFSLRINNLAAWLADDQDCQLQRVADTFSLTLRSLHPREAAHGLNASPEFTDHFVDSYRPLIQRALANSQPVLAWGCWAGQTERRWGVITEEGGTDLRLLGCVPSLSGIVPLTTAATQCHVVERLAVSRRSPLAVLRCGIESIRYTDVAASICGPAAYDHWIAWAESNENDATSDLPVTRTLLANYASGVRFLKSITPGKDPTVATDIAALTTAIQGAGDALAKINDQRGAARAELLRGVRPFEADIHTIAARLDNALSHTDHP